jgi:hypothetical protein
MRSTGGKSLVSLECERTDRSGKEAGNSNSKSRVRSWGRGGHKSRVTTANSGWGWWHAVVELELLPPISLLAERYA